MSIPGPIIPKTAKEEAREMFDKHGYKNALSLAQDFARMEGMISKGWCASLYYLAEYNNNRMWYYLEVCQEIKALHESELTKEVFNVNDMD